VSEPRHYKVWLQDEAPKIGSGIRWLFAFEGRKWTYLLAFNLDQQRLSTKAWERVRKEEASYDPEVWFEDLVDYAEGWRPHMVNERVRKLIEKIEEEANAEGNPTS